MRPSIVQSLESRRLLAAGMLDPSFADGGKFIESFSPQLVPRATAVQANGQILVAAQISETETGGRDFYLLRLHVDGSIDSSFGTKVFDLGGIDNVADLLIQPDGRIILAGRTLRQGDEFAAVARLNADGSPDNTFSGDGMVALLDPINPSVGGARTMALQPDGKILLGCANSVVRLNSNGTIDTTFSGDGIALLVSDGRTGQVSSIAVRGDGKIIVTQFVTGFRDEIAIVRFNSDGSLDGTLSGDGRQFLPGPAEAQILPLAGNKLMVASIGGRGDAVQVRRLNNDGGPDLSFGDAGSSRVPIPGAAPVMRSLIATPDGRFIAAGFSGGVTINSLDAFVARFNAAGAADPSFADGGAARLDLFAGDRLADAAIAPDGKVVFTAFAERQNSDDSFDGRTAVVRLIGTGVAPSAHITRSGTLLVQGSELDETIDIETTAAGRVAVAINNIVTTFPARNVRRVAVFAGGGSDTINASATAGASFELAGENGNDVIRANGRANLLRGGAGDDQLFGFGGDDSLFGDAGDDLLDAGSGDDFLSGGPGLDTLRGFAGADSLINDGQDTLDDGSGDDEIVG